MERPPEWEGRVVLVDRQGYRLDGAVLRPAEVWVAVGRAEQAVDGDRDVPWVDDPDEASDEQARGTP
jgi:hypothetical protein